MKTVIFLSLFFSSFSYASSNFYIEASFSEKIDHSKSSIIFIVGKSGNLGNAAYASAYTRAKVIESLMPETQVVFYRVREYSLAKEKSEMKVGPDANVLEINDKRLNGEELITYLDQFSKIKAIHFYGHSSPWYMKTESGTIANKIALRNKNAVKGKSTKGANHLEQLEWSQANLDQLADNFEDDAFITINGCNSGYYYAPELSKKWKVPVMAALTGTVFQRLHKNNKWYQNQKGYGYYPSASWAREIKISDEKSVKCPSLGCFRMKPDTVGYKGYWGDYRDGYVPFYKFFCHVSEDDQKNNQACRNAMRMNLVTMPSSAGHSLNPEIELYLNKIKDQLCINTHNIYHIRDNFDECSKEIERIAKHILENETQDLDKLKDTISYNPTKKDLFNCSYRKCDFDDMICKWRDDGEAYGKSCYLVLNENSHSAFVFGNEILEYIKAYQENAHANSSQESPDLQDEQSQ